jgi:hypothetical protein
MNETRQSAHVAATEQDGGRRPTSWAATRAEARAREQRRWRRLQHDHRFDRFRSLRMRRALVVAGYGLALVAALLTWLDSAVLFGTLPYLILLAGLGVYAVLSRTVRGTTAAPDEALDERLLALRDAAARVAYQRWGVLAVGAVFLLMLAVGRGFEVEAHHLEALFLGLALTGALTPSAVLAWREGEV